jgi:hypothetical protein
MVDRRAGPMMTIRVRRKPLATILVDMTAPPHHLQTKLDEILHEYGQVKISMEPVNDCEVLIEVWR